MIPNSTLPNVRWSARRTRRNITLLGLAALLVLTLLGLAFTVDRLRAGNRVRLERVNLAQVEQSRFFGLLRDMETSLRGYLLAGDEAFLTPYDDAVSQYTDVAAELRRRIESANLGSDQIIQDLEALEEAAQTWREQADVSLSQQQTDALNGDALQETLSASATLFEQIGQRNAALAANLEEQRETLGRLQNTYNNISLVLFVLITGTTLATLGYGISLLRRVGFLASALQSRQKRQDAYTEVISALNGPTQLTPLLQSVLPELIDSVGAHAAAVYALQGEHLAPVHAAGAA